MLYGSRGFYTGFGIVMAVVARMADHNGYRYLLGPLACSLLAALLHLLLPYNPYRTGFKSDRGIYRLDERDEGARRLVEILRSDGCRRLTLVTAVKVAALLSAIMAGFALWFRASLTWNFPSTWLFQGLAGGLLFTWIILRVQAIHWGLTIWQQEAESPRAA